MGWVVAEWRWIIYPWAAHEDLVDLTQRVLSEEAQSKRDRGAAEGAIRPGLGGEHSFGGVEELVATGRAQMREVRFRRAE